jgi:hypothetical protein
LAFAAVFLGAVSGFFVTLAAVLALFLAAVAGASLAAALEAAAARLGGMSVLGFLMVLMRASLMDYRVGCGGNWKIDVFFELVVIRRLGWYALFSTRDESM